MSWPVFALIAYAVLGVAGLIWIDMRFNPPSWVSWLMMAGVVLPYIWFLLKWAGMSDVEAFWALPLVGAVVALRLGGQWLAQKFRARNDD